MPTINDRNIVFATDSHGNNLVCVLGWKVLFSKYLQIPSAKKVFTSQEATSLANTIRAKTDNFDTKTQELFDQCIVDGLLTLDDIAYFLTQANISRIANFCENSGGFNILV